MKKGKFIVIDGPDGSGKGTEISLLKKEPLGRGTLFTHEPGASKRGEEIRKILLSQSKKDYPVSDFFLFWAARAAHVEEVIKPAIRAGRNVVSDRFDSSTFAYQIIADGHPELAELFWQCRSGVLKGCIPDAYIFLDLPVSIAEKRLKTDPTKRTKYDIKPAPYHTRVRNGFKKFASLLDSKVFIVDASRPAKQVHTDVLKILRKILH